MKWSFRPTSRLGWWTFCLALLAVVWGAFLPALVTLLAQHLGPAGLTHIPVGFSSLALELIFTIAAIVVGIIALRKGERSWMALAAFILAIVMGGFWILFAVGELASPQ